MATKADGSRRPRIGEIGPYGKTVRPVGSEYVGKDGVPMVKVAEWPTKPGSKDNWKPKNRHVWEVANGREVPSGHVVMFKDGDSCNFDPGNLECVPRGVMQRMNALKSEDPNLDWGRSGCFDAVKLMAEIDIARTKAEAGMPRRCAVCGAEFTPDVPASVSGNYATNKRTCRACLDAGRRARGGQRAKSGPATARCAVCGAEFVKERCNQVRCRSCISDKPKHGAMAQRKARGL